MKQLTPFLLAMTLATCSSTPEEVARAPKPYLVYFGTGAEAIYVSEFDPATGSDSATRLSQKAEVVGNRGI